MDRKVYTPQINSDSAFLLRRVAWAAEKPMTYTLDECIRGMVNQVDRERLCASCRDHRCLECPVSRYFGKSGLDSILR